MFSLREPYRGKENFSLGGGGGGGQGRVINEKQLE